ncbi:MAG TPA: phosphoribosylglycinamide formyltransferase [Xanthomonadales bacterium]|nr:phosphoribosylglycinamide formyltransferase [Xanthomonadales bacterium]
MPMRVAVLASGRGSNLQALIDARAAGRLDVELVAVFSDRAGAVALERARAAGIHAQSLAPKSFATRAAFDAALFAAVAAVQPQLIVCAGYMRIIDDAVVAAHAGRMINIHPSLLPRHRGLHTHEAVLAAGESLHGASVHFVTPELDGGPVVAQAPMAVLAGDTPATLAQRLLPLEHELLVATVGLIAAGRVALHGDRVLLDGAPLAAPLVYSSGQLDAG